MEVLPRKQKFRVSVAVSLWLSCLRFVGAYSLASIDERGEAIKLMVWVNDNSMVDWQHRYAALSKVLSNVGIVIQMHHLRL